MTVANLLEFDRDALAAFCEQLGEKRFRATQLFRWIHQKGAADFTQMSDLAKSLRDKLAGRATVKAMPMLSEQASADGTIKWLFDAGAGNAIETVFIPEDDRGTLCISTQAGCAVNCRFCSTGKQGFSRNLTSAEIFEQAMRFARELAARGQRLSNVVFMGMGEPFHNYEATLAAVHLLMRRLGIGARAAEQEQRREQ